MTAVVEDPAEASFARAEQAIRSVGRGNPVVIIDDVAKSGDGALMFAAEWATPELVAFAVRHGSGFVCVAMLAQDCHRLRIPRMPCVDGDPTGPAQRVTVDAVGTGTGISATARATTISALAATGSEPEDFTRPGHVVPVCARQGGVLEHHTNIEAGVDLARLAGIRPATALTAIVSSYTPQRMACPAELVGFGRMHRLDTVSTTDLIEYRHRTGR